MLKKIEPDSGVTQKITLAPKHGNDRKHWREQRDIMERSGKLQSRIGARKKQIMAFRRHLFRFFHLGSLPIYIPFLHNYLMARTRRQRISKHDVGIKNLPQEFEDYRILHLSDLHFGGVKGLEESICKTLMGLEADLIVFTGDYLDGFKDEPSRLAEPIRNVLKCIKYKDGAIAVLGNHDSWRSVDVLESLGINVLINESLYVNRNKDRLMVTGTDDPSYYFTENAVKALNQTSEDCRIALCHSSELADIAEASGISLYLCGHTHGGQICLPGGKAPHVDLQCFPQFYEGLWFLGKMVGHTSVGVGASILPYRFFKQAEVSMLRLRNGSDLEH